jgi:hypothetical protein
VIEQPKVNHNVFFQEMFNKRIKGSYNKKYLSSFQYREYVELIFRLVNIDYQNNNQISLLTEHHPDEEALRLSLEKVYSFLSYSDKQINELLGMLDKSIFSDRVIKLKEELEMECFGPIRNAIDLYLIEKNN